MSRLMDLMDTWLESHPVEVCVISQMAEIINTPRAPEKKEYKSDYYRQCIEERQRKHDEEELLKSLWEPVVMEKQRNTSKSLRDSFTIKI